MSGDTPDGVPTILDSRACEGELWGVQVRGCFFAVAFLATVWAYARQLTR